MNSPNTTFNKNSTIEKKSKSNTNNINLSNNFLTPGEKSTEEEKEGEERRGKTKLLQEITNGSSSIIENKDTPDKLNDFFQLPNDKSFQNLSMISTPGSFNLDMSINGYKPCSTTPINADNTRALKDQIHGLVQEIINKQLQIDKLQEKSDEDDKIIQNMIQTIRIMENDKAEYTKLNLSKVKINELPETVNCPSISNDKKINCNKKTIKILGDSHVRNLKYFVDRELSQKYSTECYFKSGAVYKDIENIDHDKKSSNYVIIIVGTNDVCKSLWHKVENAIFDLSKRYKDSEILIVLTPYRQDQPTLNKYINTFNNNIKSVVRKIDHVKFVETNRLFNLNDYCGDGVHFNRNGKIKLSKKIKSVVEGQYKKQSVQIEKSNNKYYNNNNIYYNDSRPGPILTKKYHKNYNSKRNWSNSHKKFPCQDHRLHWNKNNPRPNKNC